MFQNDDSKFSGDNAWSPILVGMIMLANRISLDKSVPTQSGRLILWNRTLCL